MAWSPWLNRGTPPFTGNLCFNRGCLYVWVGCLALSHGIVAYMLLVFAFVSEMEGLGTFASVVLMSSRPLCLLWSSSVRSRCSYGLVLLVWISPMDQRNDYAVRYVASMPSPQECSAVRTRMPGSSCSSLAPDDPALPVAWPAQCRTHRDAPSWPAVQGCLERPHGSH